VEDNTDSWDYLDPAVEEEDSIPRETVCRTCGKEGLHMVGIFSDDGRNYFLADKINSTLPIKVSIFC
jgi:hypothetical protein